LASVDDDVAVRPLSGFHHVHWLIGARRFE
jgi:hypothetical protein